MIKAFVGGSCGLILWALCGAFAAQAQQAQTPPSPPPPQVGRAGATPSRSPAETAAIERGKGLFGVSCGFCHGSDARGGSTGPNLWRSALVLTDREGTQLATLIRDGRPEKGMPPMALPADQIGDIVAFLHSLPVGGRDPARMRPPSILVGNAAEGERFFQKTCASCHSVTGDLRGLGAKYAEPRQLQHAWLMPGSQRGGTPASTWRPRVRVTPATGEPVEGVLARIDDFIVSLTNAAGETRTFKRTATGPRIEMQDRLEPHRKLVPTYTDADIHNLTAFLVTLK